MSETDNKDMRIPMSPGARSGILSYRARCAKTGTDPGQWGAVNMILTACTDEDVLEAVDRFHGSVVDDD